MLTKCICIRMRIRLPSYQFKDAGMSESRMGRGDQIHPGKKTHVVNLPKIDLGDPPPLLGK